MPHCKYVLLILLLLLAVESVRTLDYDCNTNWTDVAVGDSFTIESPYYPTFYPDNAHCSWSFHAPDDGVFEVVITELAFVIRIGRNIDRFVLRHGATADMLIIEETLFLSPGSTFLVRDRHLWVRFSSDVKYRARGFSLQVSRREIQGALCPSDDFNVLCSSGQWCNDGVLMCTTNCPTHGVNDSCALCNNNDFWCKSGIGCIDQSMVCDNRLDCMDGSDEFDCHKTCDDEWYGFNEFCYLLNNTMTTPPRAELQCHILEADLVSLHSQSENDFIQATLEENVMTDGMQYIIGLGDELREGIYRWFDGTDLDFSNWKAGTMHTSSNDNDCVAINMQNGYKWTEVPCDSKAGFICKKPKETCGTQWLHLGTDEITYLTSPNYPSLYDKDINCMWYISSEDPGVFAIKFLRLDIPNGNDDRVEFGVGNSTHRSENVAGNFTRRGPGYRWFIPPSIIIIPERQIWLQFSTDIWYEGPGFFLQIERTQEQVSCLASDFPCHSGYDCIDASQRCSAIPQCLDQSDEVNCDFCGNPVVNLNHNEVYHLNSIPSYPYNYPNHLECHWLITAPKDEGAIEFQILKFHLEPNYDFLTIGYGSNAEDESSRVLHLSGVKAPRSLAVQSSVAWAMFHTDMEQRWFGFVIDVIFTETYVGCLPGEFVCTFGYGCFDDLSVLCDKHLQCIDESDEFNCEYACDGEQALASSSAVSFNISSANYPSSSSVQCSWMITAESGGYTQVEFLEYELKYSYDFVVVRLWDTGDFSVVPYFLYDTEVNFPLTGQNIPKSFVSKYVYTQIIYAPYVGNTDETRLLLTISWRNETEPLVCRSEESQCEDSTHAVICLHETQRCDKLSLCPDLSDEENCGICGSSNINLGSGFNVFTLESRYYPLEYPNDMTCRWTVNGPEDKIILMRINSNFHIEEGFDFLTIGEGTNSADDKSTLVKLTGDVYLRNLASNGSNMWVVFRTDSSSPSIGFSIEITHGVSIEGVCSQNLIDCGSGVCVDYEAQCNGFNDCLNNVDEAMCESVSCPGAYTCDEIPEVETRSCVRLYQVCDGTKQCPAGDDELDCHLKKCPSGCQCTFADDLVQVKCDVTWTRDALLEVSRRTTSMTISGGKELVLQNSTFKGVPHLRTLSVTGNFFTRMEPGAFDTPSNLTWLDLSHNSNLTAILRGTFGSLVILESLFMVDVPLIVIHGGAFQGLKSLLTLVIVRGSSALRDIEVKTSAFDGISNLEIMYNDDYRLCCFFRNLDNCRSVETYSPLFNCGSLMQNQFLRIFMWVLGISAVVGNMFVIFLRLKEKASTETQSKQRLFIFHLALSDSLMGVYMVILACADVYYGDEYFKFSDDWRNGLVCRVTGFLGLLSSEASVFFIALITIDRFICVVFPLGESRMSLKASKTSVGLLWFVSLVLSAVPVLLAGPESDFYDLPDVCIGLPLITRPSSFNFESEGIGGKLKFELPVSTESKPAWYFSIILFLVVNLLCFVAIFICYLIMFIRVKSSAHNVGRKESFNDDIKMAIKMAAIVGTDFICWFPIILMGILSQVGAVVIPLDAYVWSVVFVLPINSSLNPYLYTITSLISDYRSKK